MQRMWVVMERQPAVCAGDAPGPSSYISAGETRLCGSHPRLSIRIFGMTDLGYEGRKRRSVELAVADLSGLPGWTLGRQHDMGDARLLAEQHCAMLRAEELLKERRALAGFERFRCNPVVRSRFFGCTSLLDHATLDLGPVTTDKLTLTTTA